MRSNGFKIVSPWVDFYREIEAMFKDDPDIRISFDEEENVVKLFVEGTAKAVALETLLPAERTFGNVTVRVSVIPSNESRSPVALFRDAFQGNPAFAFAQTVPDIFSNELSFVVFRKKVVQYYNDDLGDINGLRSTLYQDIAEDLFDSDGIYFCTDTVDPVFEKVEANRK